MHVPWVETLYQCVNASVSGGFVVALALICLLQYAAHFHRLRSLRRDKDRCQSELDGISTQLDQARHQRALSQFENDVLHEFLSERNADRALGRFLRLLTGDSQRGWAALLRRRDAGWCVVQSTGLSTSSLETLAAIPDWDAALKRIEPRQPGENSPVAGDVWRSLSPADRAKGDHLYVFRLGPADDMDGALVTSALLPVGFDEPTQMACVDRLAKGIGGSLRDRWRLDSQQRRLHVTAEMLALRSIADRHFDSPVAMLSQLVQEATEKTLADRGALFLYPQDAEGQVQSLVRIGASLPPEIDERWHRGEQQLALHGRSSRNLEQLCGGALCRFGAESPFGAALLAPIVRRRRTVGLLCFTRRDAAEFGEAQRQLGAWAAGLLGEMLPRAVSHAVATRQARQDPLTGLANRRTFDRRIDEEVRLAKETGGDCSLLLLDLDRFKSVNDRYGHRGGDAVLRAAAQIIRHEVQQIRASDRRVGAGPFVARYGGEELAALLPGLGHEAARRVGEAIRQRLEAAKIDVDGSVISVTTSIGLAAFPEHADGVEELVAAADAALYLAKCAGRNRLEAADQAISAAAARYLAVTS
ncbi:MAG: sensor domain-containing diguanylate cyclase [Planctomycetaceae bacterium]